jgi:CheY-like chemotaxis protein
MGRADSAPEAVRVLVVDNNLDVLNSTTALIKHTCKCEVRGCRDAAGCLTIADAWEPHLLLLDLEMPGTSGLEIAELLRSEVRLRPPIMVALTGYGTNNHRKTTADAGFTYHELKPIRLARLRELIDEAAERAGLYK